MKLLQAAGSTPEPLRWWLRFGHNLDRGRPERRISAALIALGTFALVSSLFVLAGTVATYQERLARDDARIDRGWLSGAEPLNDGPRWRAANDAVDYDWVLVLVVEPGPDSPLPPGLEGWPAPGEVVLSPALAGTAAGDVLVERYGSPSPLEIGLAGLSSPGERVIYVRPSTESVKNFSGYPLTGFGIGRKPSPFDSGFLGGVAYQRSVFEPLVGFILGLTIPSALLLLVGSRVGSHRRDRRSQILRLLGGRPREIRAALIGQVGIPYLLGCGLASALLITALCIDLPLPHVGFTVQSRDLRAHSLWLTGALLLGIALSALLVLAANRTRPGIGTRPRARVKPASWRGLLALPVATVGTVITLQQTLGWEESALRIFVVYGGLILITAALPSFLSAVTAAASSTGVRIARRFGSTGFLVGCRQTLADSVASRRLASGIALIIVLVAQAMTIGTITSSSQRAALALEQSLGTTVLSLDGIAPTSAGLDASPVSTALRAAGPDATLIALDAEVSPGGSTVRLFGDCSILGELGAPCASAAPAAAVPALRLEAAIADRAGPGARVESIPLTDDVARSDEVSWYLLSKSGADLPLEPLKTTLAHFSLPRASIDPIGRGWLIGLQESRDRSEWSILVVAAATVLLVLATLGAIVGDAASDSPAAGVATMWGADLRFAVGLTAARVVLPLAVAILIGNLVALYTTLPYMMPPLNGYLPEGFFVATAVIPILLMVLLAVASLRTVRRALGSWRPGAAT